MLAPYNKTLQTNRTLLQAGFKEGLHRPGRMLQEAKLQLKPTLIPVRKHQQQQGTAAFDASKFTNFKQSVLPNLLQNMKNTQGHSMDTDAGMQELNYINKESGVAWTVQEHRKRKKSGNSDKSNDNSDNSKTKIKKDNKNANSLKNKSPNSETPKTTAQINVPTSNKFSPLNSETSDKLDDSEVNPKVKIAPINVVLNNLITYSDLIKYFKKFKYPPHTRSVRKDVVQVYAACHDDYRTLVHLLRDNHIEYYLVSSPDKKPLKVVARGIPSSTNTTDIHENLVENGFDVKNVAQLKSMRMDKKSSPLPLYLLTLEDNEKSSTIKDVRNIAYSSVKIEAYKTPAVPRQCYKCQRYDHVSANCHALPRCVKCAKEHDSKTCSNIPREKVKCANCGGNHTANYKGCIDYKNAKKRLGKSRSTPSKKSTKHPIQRKQSFQNSASYAKTTKTTESHREYPPLRTTVRNLQPNIPVSSENVTPPNPPSNNESLNEVQRLLNLAIELTSKILAGEVSKKTASSAVANITGQLLSAALRYADENE